MEHLPKALRVPRAKVGGNLLADCEVAEDLLRPIKDRCRKDQSQLPDVARHLLQDMQRKSVTLRLRCLCIIDMLFMRSQRFRESVCEQGGIRIIARSAGLLHDENAGEPLETSGQLQERVKELVEVWDVSFGSQLPVLHAVARYFRESLKLAMPNVTARAQQFVADRQRREEDALRLLLTKRDRALRDARAELGDIEVNVRRLEDCFAVLYPAFDDIFGEVGSGGGRAVVVVPPPPLLVWVGDGGEEIGEVGREDEVRDGLLPAPTHSKRPRLEETTDAGSEPEPEWEDASDDDDDDDDDKGKQETRPVFTQAPGTLELRVRTGLPTVGSAGTKLVADGSALGLGPPPPPEHEAVLQVMRELCRFCARHALPLLAEWQTTLAQAIALPAERAAAVASTAVALHTAATCAAGPVLRRVALLRAATRKVMSRCRGAIDESTEKLLREQGEEAILLGAELPQPRPVPLPLQPRPDVEDVDAW